MRADGHQVEFRSIRAPWAFEHEIQIFVLGRSWRNGMLAGRAFGLPIVMQTMTEEDALTTKEPTLELSVGEAQGLMDELWKCGLRPTESHGSTGQLGAVQAHLNDMRKLAFKAVGVEA